MTAIFEGRRRLWADHAVRQVDAAGLRLALFGACAAPAGELVGVLTAIADGRQDAEALTGLGGSYHAVLDDGQALTVAGDLAGLRPIFTAAVSGLQMFASTPLGLAHPVRSELDADFLAARLLAPEAMELFEHSTAFTGIRRVPQDAMLRCAPEGMTLIKRRGLVVQAGYDGGAALRDALTAAVAARVGARVSTDLSGGLDSTALALIAAARPAKNLLAVTYIDPLACGDEDVAFARLAGTLLGGGTHVFVEGGTDSLPYTAIDAIDATVFDEPTQEVLLHARTRTRLAPAQGRDVHLGGDGGDVVLTGPLTYLVDLARRHQYKTLVREAAGLARLRQRPASTVVRAALRSARSGYAEQLRECADLLDGSELFEHHRWRRPGIEASLAWSRLSPAAAWSTRNTARRVGEQLRAAGMQEPQLDADAIALRAVRRHADATRQAQRLASTWGIALQAPFFDDQVVTACARVPVIERTTVAKAKPLLGAALAGIVPPQVLERRSKGDYSASEYAGLRAAGPQLRRLMAAPRLADLGLIEPGRIQPVLEAAIAGEASPMGALGDVIAAELWLRANPTTAAYQWKKK
jgi:asparagine synthase (glutamine-hydrolysing)